MIFTKSYRFQKGGTVNVGTVPPDIAQRSIYFLKVANEGGAAHALRVSQVRNTDAYNDRTTVPANNSKAFGGNYEKDRILNFQSSGTIVAALDTGQAGGAGTLDVTMGFIDL